MAKKGKTAKKRGGQGKGGGGAPKMAGTGGARQIVKNASYPKTYFRTVGSTRGVRIQGCEVLAELVTKIGFFPIISQRVNAANNLVFPRLSASARAFEHYKFHSLKFHYANGCNATVSGSIMHMFEYDVVDTTPPSALQFLANETSNVGSVTLDSSLVVKCDKFTEKQYYCKAIQQAASSAAQQRQEDVGVVRVVMDKGSSDTAFAGYYYVEYDCELMTNKPPTPTSICGSNVNNVSVPASGSKSLPANNIISDEGIPPASDATTAGYITAGGVTGALDALKAAYETGIWLADVYSEWTTAAFDVKPGVIPRSAANLSDWVVEEKGDSVMVGRSARWKHRGDVASPLALASGDVQIDLEVYDATYPLVVDPNFPASATSMTLVDIVSYVCNYGVGATKFSGNRIFTVPASKRYMWRPVFTLGPTTGRSTQNVIVATNASSGDSDV